MSDKNILTVIILAFNEEAHITRCIHNAKSITDEVFVVDSFSTDSTVSLATAAGAEVVQNKFYNQAQQYNFALDYLIHKTVDRTQWVLRLDADEIINRELATAVLSFVQNPSDYNGASVPRYICFQGKMIKRGGIFPNYVTRLHKITLGRSEARLMDEHIVVSGPVCRLQGQLIDDNVNSLDWWLEKHIKYSVREAAETLVTRRERRSNIESHTVKRKLKKHIFDRLPSLLGPFLYFMYRTVVRLGFLDGRRGIAFHFLQAFWYRALVEIRIGQVVSEVETHGVSIPQAFAKLYGYDLDSQMRSLDRDLESHNDEAK